ncbi:protein FAM3C isoform X1 [Alosa pseudoharengus]|uniref:protein FAM3C isoform X1 n=1 Tax=Alosa pseudoharengus TaxID=34774 RepID=UPI003F8BC82B
MWTIRKGQSGGGPQRRQDWKRLLIVLTTIALTWILVSYQSVLKMKVVNLLGDTEGFVQSDMFKKTYAETQDEVERRMASLGLQRRSLDKPAPSKCGINTCPDGYFAFHLKSGVANILGPRICFEGNMLMSGVANNIGRGINIALLKGDTGEVLTMARFDMYDGKVEPVVDFLNAIKVNTIVLIASFDEPAHTLTSQIRKLISDLGSTEILTLASRDSWVFAGARGVIGKSPFEQVIKSDKSNNKYKGWPETANVGGCFPQNPYKKKLNNDDLNIKL